ncbi:CoA ester lyase [Candidatus Aciduliprofundum boonei]|uniref:Citrate (Pro-3S)-lyase n=1 Tax=Aciduliprofundum boonei (strain DSM 19572 / T469) TaxID=439481 RepID=D3T9J9_ACIB4|nr:CoA ester lyase [Candidatus Aciduliprofundum boonei]ADD08778.1 Citrate (pro-3S)-lyase [Aciduliprofundum boonei T469]HII55676.1 CoA ester lyase [Candidatus Aciduliprofundum boonei]
MKLRRTRLYIPGNNPHLVENAGLYGADAVILDLEDSVPITQKFDARILVKYSLQNVDFGKSEKWVRINGIDTPYWKKDLEEILPYCDVINLPKVESLEDVNAADQEMSLIEDDNGLEPRKLVPIIETVRGLKNARDIATHPRVVALAWGGEDLTADLGIPRKKALILDYVRAEIVLAAKAEKKQALDTVFSNVKDTEGLFNYAQRARYMGFDGIGVIHPNQIEVVHRAFKPTDEEIEEARRIIEAAKEAEREGKAVISLNGRMIDPPVVERARKILALAEVD